MRLLMIAMVALAVAGCASTDKKLAAPHFDRDSGIVFADDFPVRRAYIPEDFDFVRTSRGEGVLLLHFMNDKGWFISLAYAETTTKPSQINAGSDYTKEQAGNLDVYTGFDRGMYVDLANTSLAPPNVPKCAIQVSTIIYDRESWAPVMGFYTVATNCFTAEIYSDRQKRHMKTTLQDILGVDL